MSYLAPLLLLVAFGLICARSPAFRDSIRSKLNVSLLKSNTTKILAACLAVMLLMRVRGSLPPPFGVALNYLMFAALCWAALTYSRMRTAPRRRWRGGGGRRATEQPRDDEHRAPPPPPPPPPPPGFDPYAILGLPPDATKKQISSRYRQLVSQFHPDKIGEAGPDMKKLAHERLLEVQRAYEMLEKKR